jgi:hypothetical protein
MLEVWTARGEAMTDAENKGQEKQGNAGGSGKDQKTGGASPPMRWQDFEFTDSSLKRGRGSSRLREPAANTIKKQAKS